MKLKLQKVGNSLGISFPTEILEKLRLQEGDSLSLTETEEGIQLTLYDPEFERAMQLYQEGSTKYKNALRELAK